MVNNQRIYFSMRNIKKNNEHDLITTTCCYNYNKNIKIMKNVKTEQTQEKNEEQKTPFILSFN